MGDVGDGEGGPSSAAGASDTPPPSAPATAALGGPAATTVDSGSDDDDDSGPNTFSNLTGQSTVPETQQAEMTESSRVPRVSVAETSPHEP